MEHIEKNRQPLVSVVLPVYNAEKYLNECIDSILNQTYPNFELIIINDGSSDNSQEIVNSYNDVRIRVLYNPGNRGLVYSLNRGLCEAKGKYIARMDADDISLPDRLLEQVQYMETHPEIDVCGAWLLIFGKYKEKILKYKALDRQIKERMIFSSHFGHPVVMLRAKTLKLGNYSYDENYLYAEDFDLWCRMMYDNCHFYNIPKVLLRYRVGHVSVSVKHRQKQEQLANQIVNRNIEWLYGETIPDIFRWDKRISFDEFKMGIYIIDKIIQKVTNFPFLSNKMKNYRFRYIRKHRYLGIKVWKFISVGDLLRKIIYIYNKSEGKM